MALRPKQPSLQMLNQHKYFRLSAILVAMLFLLPNTSVFAVPGTSSLGSASWIEAVESQKQSFSIVQGRSEVLRFKRPIARISISDPSILDFIVLSPSEILVNTRRVGSANLIAWDSEEQVSVYEINVIRDPGLLSEIIQDIDPEGDFDIYPSNEVFVIKGYATTETKRRQIEEAANAFAEGSVSLVEVRNDLQILLQARFIQVDRNQNFDFGADFEFDLDGSDDNILQRFLPGSTNAASSGSSTSTFGTPAVTHNLFDKNDTDVYQISYFKNDRVFQAFIKAIEAKGLGKTIARPNLLARDGQQASFLVGGEAAVLTATGDSISVDYREFGTRLTFTPEILGDGKIRLAVEPEVSALNTAFGITVGNTQVPGFSTTRVRSTVELRDGESFMIGGLLQQKLNKTDTGVPFLRRVPFIGKMFQSLDYDWSTIELLVLITPKLVGPEKAPVSEKENKFDALTTATRLLDDPIPNERARAIEQYIKTQQRFGGDAKQIEEEVKINLQKKIDERLTEIKQDQLQEKIDSFWDLRDSKDSQKEEETLPEPVKVGFPPSAFVKDETLSDLDRAKVIEAEIETQEIKDREKTLEDLEEDIEENWVPLKPRDDKPNYTIVSFQDIEEVLST